LSVGDKLPPENVLAERFGVSRVTLRESFKQLSAMGVISIRQGEGTFVNKITPSDLIEPLLPLMLAEINDYDIDDIFEARICLESGIAQMAAKNRTDDDILKLRELISDMDKCLHIEDLDCYNNLDLQFHTMIAEASKNKILLSMYLMLNEVRTRSIHISNIDVASANNSFSQHQKILSALEQQDIVNTASIMNAHLSFSRQMHEWVINS